MNRKRTNQSVEFKYTLKKPIKYECLNKLLLKGYFTVAKLLKDYIFITRSEHGKHYRAKYWFIHPNEIECHSYTGRLKKVKLCIK